MKNFVAAFVLLISTACAGPVSTRLPDEATHEHVFLAALVDYRIFLKDVNTYISLPSVTRAEAIAIDKVLDEADATVASLVEGMDSGDPIAFRLGITALEHATNRICAGRSEEIPSCAGRN